VLPAISEDNHTKELPDLPRECFLAKGDWPYIIASFLELLELLKLALPTGDDISFKSAEPSVPSLRYSKFGQLLDLFDKSISVINSHFHNRSWISTKQAHSCGFKHRR
tara:strand:- start:298 stop:621 length:324 start_codon:yes stop_codon:yes gene_type:complete